MNKHLIIPDSHAHPDFDNDRFDYLGKFIMDERPTHIIDMGDGPDMPSLSSYDKSKKSFEGREVLVDIDAYLDSQERLLGPLTRFNRRKQKNKEKQYRPKLHKLGGNHDEGRINRIVQENRELSGLLSIDKFKHKELGWQYTPYGERLFLHGIAYSHNFPSGTMGRPIGGENPAKALITKNLMSSVAGHAHILDHSERSRIDGTKLFGLVCGCYVHPDYEVQQWCKTFAHMWWRGVVVLEDVRDGYYWGGMRHITLHDLERRYG